VSSGNRSTSPLHRRAFTLVELLAVLAIVGLLAAVTIPVIGGVRASAHRAQCASNLRQIGTALYTYAADHRGLLPPTSHTTGDSTLNLGGTQIRTLDYSWIYRLAPYLGDVDEIRVCPADEPERQQLIRDYHATSYTLNDIIFDANAESGPRYNHINGLPHPGRTMWAFISARPVSRTWDHAHCADWTNWPAVLSDVAVDRHRRGDRAADRLQGSANYLFADGRVEAIEARDLKARVDSGINPGTVPL
jgi:prepilin-type N-terminal cleavage/methylation domain-containing protein/prepilin-type processing-associated H-X9-DG protein